MSDEAIDAKLFEESEKRALLFEDMARQIRLNRDAKFGGALLAIPPGQDSEPFSFITFNQEEAAIFWSIVQTLGQMAQEAMQQAQRAQGMGRR
jgi:hypothetical protein